MSKGAILHFQERTQRLKLGITRRRASEGDIIRNREADIRLMSFLTRGVRGDEIGVLIGNIGMNRLARGTMMIANTQ